MFWFEDEVKRLEKESEERNYQASMIFYGSSSIRLWSSLCDDFKQFSPVNLGFGGSTLAACTWFFDRIVAPYQAKSLVFYAGDNDLGDGRHPEEIFIFFQQLVARMDARYGSIPCYFISIKPSLLRWGLNDPLRYTNLIIEKEIADHHKNWQFIDIYNHMLDEHGNPDKSYFEQDGLHLNNKGYTLWNSIIHPKLSENLHAELT
ncbi:MAG TPA: GDSL-type esterase/lipase family protein [Mucilaginibacter sp.]